MRTLVTAMGRSKVASCSAVWSLGPDTSIAGASSQEPTLPARKEDVEGRD